MNHSPPALPVTAEQATALIHQWGALFDQHVGLSQFLPILDEQNLVMKFRDQVWQGFAGFEEHLEIKRKFFDEVHAYDDSAFEVEIKPDGTHVTSQMRWEASLREDSAPRSQRLKVDIQHRWIMKRCPRRNIPVIQFHEAEKFEYVPGFEPTGERDENHLKSDQ